MSAEGEHTTHLARYRRGRSVPFNRPTYGYTVACSCGYEQRVNGTKRYAESFARDHLRTVGAAKGKAKP